MVASIQGGNDKTASYAILMTMARFLSSKASKIHLTLTAVLLLATSLLGLLTASWWPVLLLLTGMLIWQNWQLLRLEQLISHHGINEDQHRSLQLRGIYRKIQQRLLLLEMQRRRQRKLLKSTVRELRFITESFPEPAIMLDDRGHLIWFNPAAARQLRLRKPDDHGQPLINILRYPAFTDWLAEGLSRPIDINSPADSNIKLNVRLFMLNQRRRLLLFRDVTELRNVEQVRRDFVANVSHELRTPLTVLIGYLETMLDETDPGIRMLSERMREQTAAMRNLIDDLIEISRLQSQPADHQQDVVDVCGLLAALEKQAASLNDKQHQLHFRCDSPHHLLASAKDLESAFANLIINAIRYTPAKGHIQVSWEIHESAAVFSVSDDGIGIPKEDIPRLTERFYRVTKDRSRASGGSGLGLAIVKHVLNAHDARLEINSELNRGSTFSCLFPLTRLVAAADAKRLHDNSKIAGESAGKAALLNNSTGDL